MVWGGLAAVRVLAEQLVAVRGHDERAPTVDELGALSGHAAGDEPLDDLGDGAAEASAGAAVLGVFAPGLGVVGLGDSAPCGGFQDAQLGGGVLRFGRGRRFAVVGCAAGELVERLPTACGDDGLAVAVVGDGRR